ncbi:MAG TPA: hypothetical protein VHJ20_15965, partial [Polyangia bacterium]|nr:hypothetical protein [Polyangia bacterium]
RAGDAGPVDGDGALVLGVEGADEADAEARWTMASQAELRRVPVRLGLYVSLAAGPGRLEPGLGLGVDVYSLTTNAPGGASGQHLSPFGDLALGYTLPLAGPLYVRLLTRAALAVPYDFQTLGGAPLWTTPRILGEAGVELGFAFR